MNPCAFRGDGLECERRAKDESNRIPSRVRGTGTIAYKGNDDRRKNFKMNDDQIGQVSASTIFFISSSPNTRCVCTRMHPIFIFLSFILESALIGCTTSRNEAQEELKNVYM